jgi:tripartite-type tricarboxylate transporter receptor subunit TctC
MAGPAKTPHDVIERVGGAIAALDQAPDVKARTAPLGYELHYLDATQFAEKIASDHARFGKVIRDAGITPD